MKLMPFIPEYIPAVGGTDEFIKVPRPDGQPDYLGLKVSFQALPVHASPCRSAPCPALCRGAVWLALQLFVQGQCFQGAAAAVLNRGSDTADAK